MPGIVVATQDEALRAKLTTLLLEEGYAVGSVAAWDRLVEAVARPDTRLVLLDARPAGPARPGDAGTLLRRLSESLTHRPQLAVVAGTLPPLPEVAVEGRSFRRLVARRATRTLSPEALRLLQLLGLGREPLAVLAKLARSPLPVCIQGPRGTGKKVVARALHRLGGGGRFVTVVVEEGNFHFHDDPGTEGEGGPPATAYLPLRGSWPLDLVMEVRERVVGGGGRLVVGAREPPPTGFSQWVRLVLRPLRERPDDLRMLTLHYIDLHRKRLGLPRRRFARGLWAMVHAARWPGNARELESFVVSVLSGVDRSVIHPRNLPPAIHDMLLPPPDASLQGEAAALEAVVEGHLRRVVDLYEPGGEQSLHRLVMNTAERPLLRLVLARTGGNRKLAADILGISRNTLRAHLQGLDMDTPGA